jgi:2-aminoadipate transaminase
MIEEPTYFIAVKIFESLGCNIIPISRDIDGLDINRIKEILDLNKNKRVGFYTIPTCHNPLGTTLSDNERRELTSLFNRENHFIIADEVYQFLTFDNKAPPFLFNYSNNVYSLFSFSKVLAPALRLGFILSSIDRIDNLKSSPILDSSGGVNPIGCRIIESLILKLDDHINKIRGILKERCESLMSGLEMDIKKPDGGYFLWIKNKNLKREYDGVKFHNGNNFVWNKSNKWDEYGRLSFSYYNKDELYIGGKMIREQLNINKKYVGIQGKGRLGSLIRERIDYVDVDVRRDLIPECDLIIDVSSMEGTRELLKKTDKLVICGTTGFSKEEIIELEKRYKNFIHYPNFSDGIPLIKEIIYQLNKLNWNKELIDIHHIHKKDAPSGTAKYLIENLPINIKSIREGEVIGEHKFILSNDYERIEIKHEALNRELFAEGCINKIKEILKKQNIYSASDNNFIISEEKFDIKMIRALCNYHKTDGYIYIEKDRWDIYNDDGNKVEMCGNGLRCLGGYLNDKYNIDEISVINSFGIKSEIKIQNKIVKVLMPTPILEKIEDNKYYINVGNPHIVIRNSSIKELRELSEKTNRNVSSIYYRDEKWTIMTWERGCNRITPACGSACIASSLIIENNNITFKPPSGELIKVMKEKDNYYLIGCYNKDN